MARAASPELAYRIGQEFKHKDQEGSAQHLLAHVVLGAAVSYATGNDIATGALSGVGSEVAVPALANYLYSTKDPSELTQEQKDTVTSIISIATVAAHATASGGVDNINVSQTVNDVEVGKVGVGWNWAGTPQELQYQAELDVLWIEVDGDREKYFEGVKKIGKKDALALDILLLPVGAGAKLAQAQFKAIEVLLLSANRPIVSNGLSAAARKLSSHS